MKFKAVIFDMDGVLVDTERFYSERRHEFFDKHKIKYAHLSESYFIGGTMRDIWQELLGDDFEEQLAGGLQAEYDAYKLNNPMPYEKLLFPDVKSLLSKLKAEGIKVGLASSSLMEEIQLMLKTHDLSDFFQVVLSGNDFKESKPNPEIYQVAMQKLGVSPQETLVIEDSQKGIQAGKSAGATVWGIEDVRFGIDQSQADELYLTLGQIEAAAFD